MSDDLGLQKPDPKLFSHVLYTAGRLTGAHGDAGGPTRLRRPPREAGRDARGLGPARRGARRPDARPARRGGRVGEDARRGSRACLRHGNGAKRVLIVGGGFAGMYAALHMKDAREGRPPRQRVVSADNFMQYQPFLPEVASGTIDPRAVVVPLRPVLQHATVVVGEVTSVDLERRHVHARIPDGLDVEIGFDVAGRDGRLVVAGAAGARPRRARGRVQDGAGGDLPAEPRALAAGRRGRDRRPGAAPRRADLRLRGRRVRGRRGARRARGPRARRAEQLPGARPRGDALGAGRGGPADPPRAAGRPRGLRPARTWRSGASRSSTTCAWSRRRTA